jgi:hypothetical protein
MVPKRDISEIDDEVQMKLKRKFLKGLRLLDSRVVTGEKNSPL